MLRVGHEILALEVGQTSVWITACRPSRKSVHGEHIRLVAQLGVDAVEELHKGAQLSSLMLRSLNSFASHSPRIATSARSLAAGSEMCSNRIGSVGSNVLVALRQLDALDHWIAVFLREYSRRQSVFR